MSVPLYARVRDEIVQRIVGGRLRAGEMLPSETDLAAEFGVSQGTARKALIELENRGIVERRQGKGTFVAVTTPERALFHFFRLRRADGTAVVPELIRETVRRRRATAAERDAFGDPGPVLEIARVRGVEGAPVVRETAVVPALLFPGLAERAPLPNALYALYQSAWHVAVVQAEEKLSAVAAQEADAAAFGVAEGTPLLEARRRATDLAGRIVELRQSRYWLDGLHYAIRLR